VVSTTEKEMYKSELEADFLVAEVEASTRPFGKTSALQDKWSPLHWIIDQLAEIKADLCLLRRATGNARRDDIR